MSDVAFIVKRDHPLVGVQFDEEDTGWVQTLPSRRVMSSGKKLYAVCTIQVNGTIKRHHLARMIAGLPPSDRREVDHINGDSLDNRRANLRIVTRSMQQQNLTPRSLDRGISWNKRRKRWMVSAQVCGHRVYGGSFTEKVEAQRAASDLRRKLLDDALAEGLLDAPESVPTLSSNTILRDLLASIPRSHFMSRRTCCKHGHLFDAENTIWTDRGWRKCRACRKRIESDYRRRLKLVVVVS